MKLSEIKGKKAIIAFANMITPVSEILADEEIVNDIRADKPKLLVTQNIMLKHPESVEKMLGIMEGADPETYEANFLTIPKLLYELFTDEAIVDLFTLQGQNEEEDVSGSAMVNTGDMNN